MATDEAKQNEAEETEAPEVAEEKPLNVKEDIDSALDKALADVKDAEAPAEKPEKPAKEEAEPEKEAAEPEAEEPAKDEKAGRKYEAPAEFNAEEKAAFRQMAPKAQEATLRLHNQRTAQWSHFTNKVQQELEANRELTAVAAPYLKQRLLDGVDATRATAQAIGVTVALNQNPVEAIKKIMKVKGITLEALSDAAPAAQRVNFDEQIAPVKSQLESVQRELEAAKVEKIGQKFGQVFDSLATEQNAGGSQRFPDLVNDDSGIALASKIGSLIRDQRWVQATQQRIPGAGLKELVVEAYRFFGGRVDETSSSKSPQQHTNHVQRARRAAASVPGRGMSSGDVSRRGKAKSLDEALDRALEDLATE